MEGVELLPGDVKVLRDFKQPDGTKTGGQARAVRDNDTVGAFSFATSSRQQAGMRVYAKHAPPLLLCHGPFRCQQRQHLAWAASHPCGLIITLSLLTSRHLIP